jgi:hypothetical protein
MTYRLSDLLPYSEDILLTSLQDRIRILQLLLFYYRSSQDAISAFTSKKYTEFDAQVSENLCQIRAYQLTQIVRKSNEDESDSNSLTVINLKFNQLFATCDALLSSYVYLSKKRPSYYSKIIDQETTLKDFLREHKFDLDFSDLAYFLTQTYILSKYKLVGEYNISHGIDYDDLCNNLNIQSRTYVRKIIHKLQRNISKYSCQFIFNIMSNLDFDNRHNFLLQSLYFNDEVGRHVFPSYESTNIILQHKIKNGLGVKVVVNRISDNGSDNIIFLLKPSQAHKKYVLSSANEFDSYDGLTTFIGIARYNGQISESKELYISKFLNIGFENIILANMAQHPQYAGILLDDKKHNPYITLNVNGLQQSYIDYIREAESRFLKHKHISTSIGCTPNNAGLFLLTHVRCDNLTYQEKSSIDCCVGIGA